jgi:hypothetical protein
MDDTQQKYLLDRLPPLVMGLLVWALFIYLSVDLASYW